LCRAFHEWTGEFARDRDYRLIVRHKRLASFLSQRHIHGVVCREPAGNPRCDRLQLRLSNLEEEVSERVGELEEGFLVPSPSHIWGNIWYQEAHNSTAIEGNTLVLREVELLLKEGRAVGDKQLAEYLEVQGYAEAAQWVYQQGLVPGDWTTGDLITLTEVRHVHRLAMSKVWEVSPHPDATEREGPGSFRDHHIQRFPGGMQPPDWPEVQALMTDWVEKASKLASTEGPLPEALAEVHAEFERIHPFLDGNGRVGRLTTNLLLIRLGYPPAIIRKAERSGTWRTSDAPTPATRDHLESSLRERFSTRSCASSCPRLRGPRGSFRSPLSPTRSCPLARSVRRLSVGACVPSVTSGDNGAAHGNGPTSTERTATSATRKSRACERTASNAARSSDWFP
jgi:fido (protein-threonine AMPylation protein)